MANRSNHYEAAFEAYVRSLRVPCVAVDEAKRALFDGGGVKNPDFLLYPRGALNLVVEVKGKRGKNAQGRRPWENWVTTDDLDGLARWQEMFGPGFRAVLAFVYAEPLPPFPLPRDGGAFEFRNLDYRFWAVGLDDYVRHLRSRGPAWKAVAMARREFRRRVRPLREWLPMTPACPVRPQPLNKERER
ncbi:MAG: HYExAFE family protein [Isosphaeraceae bacterium]